MIEETSMLYWYPKTSKLNIPQPKTEMIKLNKPIEFAEVLDGDCSNLDPYMPSILYMAERIGFPLFMRTDLCSGKHNWNDTCFIKKPKDLKRNIISLIEDNLMKDQWYQALVFREYIPMASQFTAFYGKLPINPERRYFIRDGKVICHHPYWIEDAIQNPDKENWKELLKEMNTEDKVEIMVLTYYADKIGRVLKGEWSIDFCKARTGLWYFIDCAEAETSWHPECDKWGENGSQ